MLQRSFEPRGNVVSSKRLSRAVRREPAAFAEMRRAVEVQDGRAFLAAAERIDWARASGDEHLAAVRLALEVGAFDLARRLSAEGAERHPRHEELGRAAYVLAPPRVLSVGGPRVTGVAENFAWLRDHSAPYRGEWVAVCQGELVGHAATFDALRDRVEAGPGVLFTRVQ